MKEITIEEAIENLHLKLRNLRNQLSDIVSKSTSARILIGGKEPQSISGYSYPETSIEQTLVTIAMITFFIEHDVNEIFKYIKENANK